MKRNVWILLIAVLLVGITLFQNFSSASEEMVLPEEQAPKANYLAPKFTLKAMDGEKYTVGGKRDKPLLINFWASWCGPCHEEADDLVYLHDKYKDKLDIYAVNITEMELKLEHVKDFVEAYQFEFPVLIDEKDQFTNKYVTEKYKVMAYPTSFLVDTNGVVREVVPRILLEQDIERIENSLK